MNFNDDITQITVELPSSWQRMLYCMAAVAIGLFVAYMVALWRYFRISRTSKLWFTVLFASVITTTLATIFLENIFY